MTSARDNAILFAEANYDSRPLFAPDGDFLGFRIGEAKFWTCGPKVSLLAEQTVNPEGLFGMLDSLKLSLRDDQLTGTEGENIIENGARLCYLSHGVGRSHEENIRHLRAVGHNSVFRHAVMVIGIAFVSRGFTHELVRHAAGTAYSQVSSRYVDAEELGIVIPEIFMGNNHLLDLFIHSTLNSLQTYWESMKEVEAMFLAQGHPKSSIRKLARGACRELLPIGTGQVLQMTLNADAARHILRMRGSSAAEIQIRKFAIELAKLCKAQWPVLMDDVVIDNGNLTVRVG